MKKAFPFKETTRQQEWGIQHGVEVECPLCGEERFIGRSKYKSKFTKGHKCKICGATMVPVLVCRKCKARLATEVQGDKIIVRATKK